MAAKRGKLPRQEQRLQNFVNKCLRSILSIKWSDKIRTKELWESIGQERVELQILRYKWG